MFQSRNLFETRVSDVSIAVACKSASCGLKLLVLVCKAVVFEDPNFINYPF
jgi:hypothetical protein